MKNTETKESNQEIIFISATDEAEIEKQLEKAKELLVTKTLQTRIIINGIYEGDLKKAADKFSDLGCPYSKYSGSVLSDKTDKYFENHTNTQNLIVLK